MNLMVLFPLLPTLLGFWTLPEEVTFPSYDPWRGLEIPVITPTTWIRIAVQELLTDKPVDVVEGPSRTSLQ